MGNRGKTVPGPERYRFLVDSSLMGIVVHQEFKPLYVNQAYAEMFGYDRPDDILQMDSIELSQAMASIKLSESSDPNDYFLPLQLMKEEECFLMKHQNIT